MSQTLTGPIDLTGMDHYDVWTYKDHEWGIRQSSTGITSTAGGVTIFVSPRHIDGCQNMKPDYVPEGHS